MSAGTSIYRWRTLRGKPHIFLHKGHWTFTVAITTSRNEAGQALGFVQKLNRERKARELSGASQIQSSL